MNFCGSKSYLNPLSKICITCPNRDHVLMVYQFTKLNNFYILGTNLTPKIKCETEVSCLSHLSRIFDVHLTFKGQSWGFKSRSTARVILGQAFRKLPLVGVKLTQR